MIDIHSNRQWKKFFIRHAFNFGNNLSEKESVIIEISDLIRKRKKRGYIKLLKAFSDSIIDHEHLHTSLDWLFPKEFPRNATNTPPIDEENLLDSSPSERSKIIFQEHYHRSWNSMKVRKSSDSQYPCIHPRKDSTSISTDRTSSLQSNSMFIRRIWTKDNSNQKQNLFLFLLRIDFFFFVIIAGDII